MIAVLGSGFGLYGHLPALVGLGCSVGTLARYRPLLEERIELRDLAGRVRWLEHEDAVLDAEVVVLARRPADNAAVVDTLARRGWKGQLVLEKPVGPDPMQAQALSARLDRAGWRWSVPYLFLFCDWFQELRRAVQAPQGCAARIVWRHAQSPAVRSWKQQPAEGGGALAFYFIHALAVAEAILPEATQTIRCTRNAAGNVNLGMSSTRGASSLHTELSVTASPAEPSFEVQVAESVLMRHTSPFGRVPARGCSDPRIPVLAQFYEHVVFGAQPQSSAFHARIHQLWSTFAAATESSS